MGRNQIVTLLVLLGAVATTVVLVSRRDPDIEVRPRARFGLVDIEEG